MVEATLELSARYLCDICKKLIEDEVGKLPGVEAVRADTRTRQVAVCFDAALTPFAKIEEVARKLGCHIHCWYWTDERYKRIPADVHI